MSVSPTAKANSARHDLNDAALGTYLLKSNTIPGLRLPVVSTKIGYGQSNPTYFLDDAAYATWSLSCLPRYTLMLTGEIPRGTRFILRKKPSGTIISPVAHQVDREFRVLKALGSVKGFPVPRVYALSMDSSIIGTPFYVCHRNRVVPGHGSGMLMLSRNR